METTKKVSWGAIALVIAAQAGFLGWMVWERVSLLKSGREISLKVIPVDPRDLFRGDFVILGYEISPVVVEKAKQGPLPEAVVWGAPVYVTITPDAAKGWTSTALSTSYPASVAAGDAVLKGVVMTIDGDDRSETRSVRVQFGIENYFVPEGEGREIEKKVRENQVEAVVAVGADGEAALKALSVGGKHIHEQPLL